MVVGIHLSRLWIRGRTSVRLTRVEVYAVPAGGRTQLEREEPVRTVNEPVVELVRAVPPARRRPRASGSRVVERVAHGCSEDELEVVGNRLVDLTRQAHRLAVVVEERVANLRGYRCVVGNPLQRRYPIARRVGFVGTGSGPALNRGLARHRNLEQRRTEVLVLVVGVV